MKIEPLTKLATFVEQARTGELSARHLSLLEDSVSIIELAASFPPALTILVGPEGGWTSEEVEGFKAAGVGPIRLTQTILRVETAAVAAAAIIQSALTLGPSAATIVSATARKPI